MSHGDVYEGYTGDAHNARREADRETLRHRVAARLWQNQAEALYESWSHALREVNPDARAPFDKIEMIASITRLIDQEVDAVMHLKDKRE